MLQLKLRGFGRFSADQGAVDAEMCPADGFTEELCCFRFLDVNLELPSRSFSSRLHFKDRRTLADSLPVKGPHAVAALRHLGTA